MSNEANQFSAAPSAAGYLYQARTALLLAIPLAYKEPNVEVSIETIDDVTFEVDQQPLQLLQLKHRINKVADLTDFSSDLWKTLRIWSKLVADTPSIPSRTKLTLVTTGIVPDGAAAALLKPAFAYGSDGGRNPKAASELLTVAATESKNQNLAAAFNAYLALTPGMRASLLSAIEVLDGQQNLADIEGAIETSISMLAPRGKAQKARELLEGWWWPRICTALVETPTGKIAIGEIEARMDDIREMMKRDALIPDFEFAEVPAIEADKYDNFKFIRQLDLIGVGGNSVSYAKRDYYRAFAQRSKWTREHMGLESDLGNYEARLVEEWQPRFGRMAAAASGASEQDLRIAGQDLYTWVETEARFPFKGETWRYLSVGSYHILSNDLRVGWHPDYEKRCRAEK